MGVVCERTVCMYNRRGLCVFGVVHLNSEGMCLDMNLEPHDLQEKGC